VGKVIGSFFGKINNTLAKKAA